jgi:hypothetical protein
MLRKSSVMLCAAVFMSALLVGTAAAQDNNWNQRTYFTFSGPVALPGKTLPAGTYLFRLLDSPSNRHIVQVFDRDERKILLTALALPAERLTPAEEPEVRFMETPADQPAAIRTWWFPGRTIGHEFIYPREQAMRLAAASKSPVLTVASDASTTEEMKNAELARVDEQGKTMPAESEQRAASDVTGKAVTGQTEMAAEQAKTETQPEAQPESQTAMTEPQSTPATPSAPETPETAAQETQAAERAEATEPTTDAVRTSAERTELPGTATPLPLIALVGLGSLAGAAALRLRRK